MPSWKKVIISGSAAELSSVFAPSITGSLLGTASYAIYAETASLSNATTLTQVLVLNQAGFTINKGVVVRITGSNNASDIPRITTASYEDDNNSANTLGIASQQITNGSQGYVITEGVLTGIDTTGWTSGTLLFLGATGSITASAPQAPLHAVRLGQVIREQNNNGSIHVRIDNGYEIGELHDVRDTTTTTSFGDLLVKSGSVWVNSKQLTGSYGLTGSLTIDSNGPDGLILDTDLVSSTNSTRIFLKNSGSSQDISLRNNNHSLLIGYSASAGVSSGPWITQISGSGVAIGNNYTVSAGRGAILQLSGSVNIEEEFAYKQDGENVIYITRGTEITPYSSVVIGSKAASGSLLYREVVVGYLALSDSQGQNQTAVGYAAGRYNSGSNQTLIGWGAGFTSTGSNQTAIGHQAGYLNNATNQTAVGYGAGFTNTATQQTAVGLQAGYLNIGVAQTAIGQQAGQSNSGSSQTAVGYAAGFQNSGSLQVAIGSQAGRDNIGSSQTAVGYEAGRLNNGNSQTAIGSDAGYSNAGSNQTATGFESGYQNTGTEQSAFGWRAGYQNTGNNMTAVGAAAGYQNSGSGLTAIGTDTGRTNKGTLNTFVGYQAGYFTTGLTINTGSVQSVFLGASTRAGGGNRTNQIVIGYLAEGIGSNSVVLGNSSITTTALRGSVGIGTTTPLESLHVTGSAIISGSLTVGSGSIGSSENTLILGVPPAGGTGEGGQLLLSAAGGTYTTASMLDNYQNKFRILRGTNAGSDAYKFQLDMHSGQLQLPNYNSSTAFSGTAAGYLAFDTSGNILTTAGVAAGAAGSDTQVQYNSGGALTGTSALRIVSSTVQMSGSVGVTGSLTATNAVIAQANGAMYFRGGDDAELWDINVANTVGIYGQQNSQQGAVKLGSGGPTLHGSGSRLGIGTTAPVATLDINGNLFVANGITGSFTGSLVGALTGTASYSTIKTSGTTIYSTDPPAGPSFSTVGGIFLGEGAAAFATNAQYSNFIGNDAGITATNASYSNIIGYQSGYIATNASYSNIIGYQAGNGAENASYSNLFGFRAGQKVGTNNIGSNNIIIGTNITLPNNAANAINIGGIIFGTGSNTYTGIDPVSSSMQNGRIGICVTNPSATLDVSGSFNVSGSYNSPSGNTIDSNALIQASLLYLSNNF